jgi:hypothetical protein
LGHYSSFIIRLWIEPQSGYRWGIIQHVATRNKRRFSTFEEMVDFMAQHSGGDILIQPADAQGGEADPFADILGNLRSLEAAVDEAQPRIKGRDPDKN